MGFCADSFSLNAWPVAFSLLLFLFYSWLSQSTEREFLRMSMMVVDASGSKKRKRAGSAAGPSQGFSQSRAFIGPMPRGSRQRGFGARSVTETGFVDSDLNVYELDTTGTIILLNIVVQGVGTSQRIGKRITLKSIQFHGDLQNNSASTVNGVAILLVYDKRPDGNLPSITDILNTANSTSFNNDSNSGRFRVMKRVDAQLHGGVGAATLTSNSSMSADWFVDLKGLPQVFKSAGTGAIGDIEEGALYLLGVGDRTAGTTAAVASIRSRMRYMDV